MKKYLRILSLVALFCVPWGGDFNAAAQNCNAITSFPWTENFNILSVQNSIPECWNKSEGDMASWAPDYQWGYNTYTSNGGYGSTQGTSHDGSNCINFGSPILSAGHYNYLKTLPLSLPATPAMKLTFAYKNPLGGDFSVYISTDGGATHETALVTGLTGASEWTQRIIDLSAYAGQEVTIVFKGTTSDNGYDAYIYLDDVTVGPCTPPSALTATDITTTGTTLGWTENGSATSWVLQYSTNIAFGTYTEVEVSTTPTQDITGLSPNTVYYARVKAVCGDNNESGWSIVARFVTPCEAITSFPWAENFNGLTENYTIPDCWDNVEGSTSEAAMRWSCYPGDRSYDNSKCVEFNSVHNMAGIVNYLKTPKLSLPASPATELSFWFKNRAGGDFSVYISTDGGATHETALATGLTGVSNWTLQTIDLSAYAGQTVVIVFKGTSNGGNHEDDAYIYLDDVKVATCYRPNALAASDITSSSATLGWTPAGSATSWVLQYGTDANFGTYTEVTVSTTPSHTITGLTPETAYYARVKAVCGANDESVWSNVINFTTLATCPAPTALTVGRVTGSTADLSWTENGNASSWQYCLNGGDPVTVTSNPYTLTGLTATTNYTVKVRAYCSANDQSTWSNEEAFTTLVSCPAPTALLLSNITTTEVTLSWTENGIATSWQYRLNGGTPVTVTTNPYTISGLTPNTDYTVEVRAYCSENEQSEWCGGEAFTTLVSCPVPTALSMSNITTTGATLSWTENGSATSWQICLNGDEANLITANGNSYTFTSLTHSTAYTVKVRAYCNANDQSEWSSVEAFRTECGIVTSFPWREDFNSLTEDNSIPACWDNSEGSGSPWKWCYSSYYCSERHNGEKCVYFYTGGSSQDKYNYLRTSSLSLPASPMQLTFWYDNHYYGTITVYISTDGGTSMTELNTLYGNNNGWTKETIDLSTYVNQEVVIFFKGTSGGNYGYDNIYLDDIAVSALCSQPTALAVTAVTATTATLSWTGSGSSWQVSINNGDPITVDENPYTCTGLTASTAYTVKVRTFCDENDQSEWSSVSFTTPCEAITSFPWTEDFNSLSVNHSIPACWDNTDGTTTGNNSYYRWCYNTDGSSTTNGTSHDGSNCVRFESYNNPNGNTNFLKTKPISLPAEPMQLTFWYKNISGGDFSVYISADGGLTYATSLATGLTGTSGWTQCQPISLSSYANQEVVIVFKGTSNYGNSNAIIYLDDVTVSLPPTCPAPNGLSVSSITSTTAVLSWTETGTATAWQICLNGDEEHPIAANNNPFTVTGLNAYTDYTVKVRAYCADNDQSEWSSAESFRTACGIVTTFPWTENFNSLTENGSIPACWNNSEGTTTNSNHRWCYNTGAPGASNSNGHNGSKCVRFDSYYNGSGNTNFLKTPTFSLPANTAPQLTFWYLFSNGGDFSVYISSDGGEMTSLVSSLPSGVDSWTQQTVDLSSYVGHEVVIAFKGTSDYSSYQNAFIYLDDVTVKAPTCFVPSGLSLSGTTATSATFSWTQTGSATAWQICLNGDEEHLIDADSNPFTVTGLTSGTSYTAKVRAYCDANDQSEWSNVVNFNTDCEVITSFPWSEDFESFDLGNFAAPCWENEHITGSSTSIFQVDLPDNGNNTRQIKLPDMQSGNMTKLVLPPMNLPNTNYQFSIDVYRSGYDGGDDEGIRIFVSADGEIEGATELAFIPRRYSAEGVYIPAESNSGWYTYELSLGVSGTRYIILRGESQWVAATFMDNFLVKAGPSCPTPMRLTESDITTTSATLGWTEIGSATAWQICLNGDEENLITANSNPFTVTGLTSDIAYTAKVRAYCSAEEQSAWSSVVNFATLPTCPAPTLLSSSSISTTEVTLSWTETGTATAWQICLNGDEANLITANSNPFTVTGLTSGTAYTAKVRAYCDVEDQSAWSNVVNFNTDCEVITSFPWTENFNSLTVNYSIPDCWDNSRGTIAIEFGRWCYSSASPGASNGTSYDGSNCVRFNSYYPDANSTNYLKTPTLRLPANAALQLTFWYKNATGGDFSVYISTDGGTTLEQTALVTGLTDVPNWTQQIIDLSGYAGQEVVIVFKGTSNYGNNTAFVYLDDVTVKVSTKDITANKWYAISSPTHDNGETFESVTNVTNLTNPNYDLFRFNETTGTWENYKAHNGETGSTDATFTSLAIGRGYIYRCSDARALVYTGATNSAESYSVTLTNTNATGELKGFNLVGNPYPYRVKLDRAYYSLNADGSWTAHPDGDSLEVGQGALVYTTTNNEPLTFYRATRSTNAGSKGTLPPLPKGLCLGDDCDGSTGSPQAGNLPFVLWDGNQLVITGTGLLTAYDALGRELLRQEIKESHFSLLTSRFPNPGVYVLRLNGQSQKIVINK